jgi:hypothetical protein
MRMAWPLGPFLSVAATVTFLTGCSGGGSPVPGATTPLAATSVGGQADQIDVARVNAPGGNAVIVSDAGSNSIRVFDSLGHQDAKLANGLNAPQGLTTDAAENLYVANEQAHNVLVYAKPYQKVALTLADTYEYPTDVAVSQAGIVGVMNLQSTTNDGGDVTLYAKGSTTACATVGDPNWDGMYFGAFDASGNLFIDGIDRDGNPLVGEITGGCSATAVTTLSVSNTLYNVAGVQVLNGNVLILDQVYNTFSPVIYTYAPPSGGSLGAPTATTKLSRGIEMIGFALAKNDRSLWIAHSDEASGRIKYTYPGGKFVQSFNEPSLVTAVGVALNPAAKP